MAVYTVLFTPSLLFVLVLGLNIAHAQKATWNLPRDVGKTNNQISFSQGSNGVWYFMESASLRHIPSIYSMLADYAAPCQGNLADQLINGLACWRDPSHTIDHAPLVAFNFTSKVQFPLPGLGYPPRSLIVHPAPDRFAIVAWKSPLNAVVSITGSFTDLNPICGNGVLWSIDKGAQRLSSGDLPNGGAQNVSLSSVVVSQGQVLYFIVDPKNGDNGCDSTMLDLNIAEAK